VRRVLKATPDVRERLLGAWRLESWDWRDEAGKVGSPLGDDPVGQLMYDGSGSVSAQLMRRNQPRFADDDWRRADTAERAAAWLGYFCYFGTYAVDEAAGTVTHHVEGSSFPNLVGTDQLRYFALAGNRLSLTAQTPWGRVTLVWEKI
jgi:hypothetical protein